MPGELNSLDIQTRGVDAFGNIEPLSAEPGDWLQLKPYTSLVLGTVRDQRSIGLADVPVTGMPSLETGVRSNAAGAWLGHVQDAGQPYTVTASLGASAFSLSSLAFESGADGARVADLELPPATNVLANPTFEYAGQGWTPASGAVVEWVAPSGSEPDYLRLGGLVSGGSDVLVSGPIDRATAAISGTTHLLALRDQTLGSTLLACSPGGGCAAQPLPDATPLNLVVGPERTLGAIFQESDLTRTFRARDVAGVWSAGEAFPYLGGGSPNLLVDSAGRWFYLWVEGDGMVHLTRREETGVWTVAIQLFALGQGAQAVFDSADTLHIVGCGSAGVVSATWNKASGTSAPISVSSAACTRYMLTVIDTSGDLYAVWESGGALAFSRRPAGGEWGDTAFLSGQTPVFAWPVVGREGRPTVAVVSASGGMDFLEATPDDGWASNGWSSVMRPNPHLPIAPWWLAFDAAGKKAYVMSMASMDGRGYSLMAFDLSPSGLDSAIRQVVTIPSGMLAPTLSVRYRVHNTNLKPLMTLAIQGASDSEPTTFEIPAVWPWSTDWVDVSAWAGETVTVTVGVDANGSPFGAQADLDYVYLGAWTTPSVTGLTPARLEAGSGTVTLTGVNFIGAPTVRIAGQTLPTTLIDAQHLSVTIPPGLALGRHIVVVANPDGLAAIAPVSLTVGHALDLPVLLRWGH